MFSSPKGSFNVLIYLHRYQKDVDSGELEVVGVNVQAVDEPAPTDLLKVDPENEREQVARLAAFKSDRAMPPVREALEEIQQRASGTDNLMPAIVDAVRARATVGEIADAMREVYGEYREEVVI